MRPHRPGLFFALCAVPVLALAGCEDDDETPGTAQLRVTHAAPGIDAIDLYLRGARAPFVQDLAYGSTSAYVAVQPGTHTIDVRPAGADLTTAALASARAVRVDENGRYTAIAAGNAASSADEDSLRVLALRESFDASSGNAARVRVVNAAPDVPEIDLDFGADGTPEIEGLERFEATEASGFDLPSGTLLPLGVSSQGQPLTAFTTPTFGASSEVLLIVTGLLTVPARETTSLSLVSVDREGASSFVAQNPALYLFHGSPDAGAIDVFSGEREVADDVTFGELAQIQLEPGTHTLDVFVATGGPSLRPASAPLASVTTPELDVGQAYLAVAAGELFTAPPTFRLITVREQFELDDDGARVRAVHGSADAPAIDLGLVEEPGEMAEPPLVSGLSFAESTDAAGLSVPAEPVTFGIAPVGSDVTAVEGELEIAPSERAFVIAAGSFAGGENPLELFVVDTGVLPWMVRALPEP